MLVSSNPFTYTPIDVCGDVDIPIFPVTQECVSYSQLRTEIAGVFIVPPDVGYPANWEDFGEWFDGYINNAGTGGSRYLVGRGGFVQTEKENIVLAGGRVEENRERTQRLTFSVLNMDSGHVNFGRQLQSNKKNFSFWLYTIGGRVIGGDNGMRPIFVDAEFVFAQGNASREVMNITIDTEFINFPAW